MNFPKLMVIIVVAVVVIGAFMFFTGVDRSNPAEVATAFTEAMKKKDTKAAAKFYLPDQADAWRTTMDTKIDGMKSGTFTDYFDRIPEEPAFTAPAGASGKVHLESVDKAMALDLTEVDSKWYVSGSNL